MPGTEFEGRRLEQIIVATAGRADKAELFNNAGQVWNHNFYWRCFRAGGGDDPVAGWASASRPPSAALRHSERISATAAVSQFGSGWAWLVADAGTLRIVKTSNAENPLAHGQTALLAVDVWEHAYYIDYQNRRPEYVDAVLDRLIDWDFAAENLDACGRRRSIPPTPDPEGYPVPRRGFAPRACCAEQMGT